MTATDRDRCKLATRDAAVLAVVLFGIPWLIILICAAINLEGAN